MKTVVLSILALFAVISASLIVGCQSIPLLATAQTKIISGVQDYCKEPQVSRQALRSSVNEGLKGSATICVQCAGDAPDPSCVAPPAAVPAPAK